MAATDQILMERIVVSREIAHGQPRIAGTRVLVHVVLDLLAEGKPLSEIISDDYFPDLTEADVLACIAYGAQLVKNETVIPIV